MAQVAASPKDQFTDPLWRLNNLYWILNKSGERIPFRMNPGQEQFFEDMWYCNLLLKARQRGFTTAIQLFMLDACLFNSGIAAGTVAHTRDAAEEIFDNKVKYAYDNLPEGIKNTRQAVQDSIRSLKFDNDSSLVVGTSLRSGTYQYLHISEYGKMCARYPDKAKEVRTGALNTVDTGQLIFVESTAEGHEGHFFEMCQQARAKAQAGKNLSKLDFKFHFFPWQDQAEYQLDDNVLIPAEFEEYFEQLETEFGIHLTPQQKAWYVAKSENQLEEMKREYPSTADEAFEASIEGAYFGHYIAKARQKGRIGRVPFDSALRVNTFWDLGMDDSMTIWLHQHHGLEHRFIGYYENSGEGLEHYISWLEEEREKHGYIYGEHYGPHDLQVRELLAKGKTRKEAAKNLGIDFIVVPRTENKGDSIQAVRAILSMCWFDEANCARGIKCLENYKKEWDEKLGVFKNKPRRDQYAHGADGFMTFADGYQPHSKAHTGPLNYPKMSVA